MSPKCPQIAIWEFDRLDLQKREKPRKSMDLRGFRHSEGDGTRTRNHRIDSPVL
jgi:hypothetical protein